MSFFLPVLVRAVVRVPFPIPVFMGLLTCGHVHVHVFVPKLVRVPTSVSVCVRAGECVRACMGDFVCACVRDCAYVCGCVHTCLIAYTHVAVYVPVSYCVRACVCVCNDNKEETTRVFTSLSLFHLFRIHFRCL